MARFEHRAAIVTGAGGDIGAAVATRLAAEGARLALFDRDVDLLDEVADKCRAADGEVIIVAVDQTDRAAVDDGVARVVAAFDGVDVLFANAGYAKFVTFLEQPLKEWHRHVDVNLTGTFHVCQEVARQMVARGQGGAIVVNASSGAAQYSDLLSAYCATKAALRMLAIGMASELGAHRIRVNAVLPGVIETGMTGPVLDGEQGQEHRDVLLADTPAGRLGDPADVAALVLFLASDEAAFITGQGILVDGGQTIHGHPRWFRADYRDAHEEKWVVSR